MIFYWMNHLASSAVDMQRRAVVILNSSCGFWVPLTIGIEGRNLVRTGEREGEAAPTPVKVL